MKKEATRLDQAMVARGLAASRERARALILAGRVRVAGVVVSKASATIPTSAGAGSSSRTRWMSSRLM